MKADFVKYLVCPACGHDNLEMKATQTTYEVREGSLRCVSCGHNLRINNGVIMSLDKPPEEILKEQNYGDEHQLEVKERIAQYSPEITNDITADPHFHELPKQIAKGQVFNRRILALFEHAVKKAKLPKGALILDVGSGNCWLSYRLAQKEYRPVATDIVLPPHVGLESHDLFHQQQNLTFERIYHDSNKPLPIKPGSFDAIFTSASLHHIVNLEGFAAESYRLLKTGGKIVAFREPLCALWEHDSKEHARLRATLGTQEQARNWFTYRAPFLKSGFKVSTYFCDSYELACALPFTAIDTQYPAFDVPRNLFPTKKERLLLKLIQIPFINKLYHSLCARIMATFLGNADRFRRFEFCLIATKK